MLQRSEHNDTGVFARGRGDHADRPARRRSAERAATGGGAARDAHRLRDGLIWTSVLGLLLLGIGLAIPDLRGVLGRVAHARLGWLLLGVVLELGSCIGYVITVRLVMSRSPARETRWLAWAEMAFGALVPVGGAGGLAVGAWAMRAWGIAWSWIANRSAVIFLLTSAVNAAVLALAGLGVWIGIGAARGGLLYGLLPVVAGSGAIAFFLLVPRLRLRAHPHDHAADHPGRLEPLVRRVGSWVSDTEVIAFRLDPRLLGAIAYLLLDIAVLWACLRAVGTNPPLLAIVLGYQVGYLANIVPIPGGVGALDGGLLGALLVYGLPAAPTAAAVVLYHAIALWVPAVGGTYGFVRLRRSVASRAVVAPGAVPPARAGGARLEVVRDEAAQAQRGEVARAQRGEVAQAQRCEVAQAQASAASELAA